MKGRVKSTILTCLNLLLVEGLGADDTRRILHGKTKPGEIWPWIVRLFVVMEDGNSLHYGGTVITERWILTSAHAARSPNCESIEIYPSTWKPGDTTTIRAELCEPHPLHRFNAYYFHNIGLLKSNENLQSPDFATKNLPPEGIHNCPGNLALIFGWGTDESGVEPGVLQWAPVKIESWKKCNEEFRRADNRKESAPSVVIPKTSFCTNGTDNKGAGTCIGDSGGPITVNSVLVGVIDEGLGNDVGRCSPLSVHTSIADYLPWIYSVIEPEKDTSDIIVGLQ